jgi:outer membrane murein-binding lipoprotein Lpp
MHGSRGLWGERRTIARLGALALAVGLCLLVVAPAGGAPLIGKDGKVYACYKTKGKAKGSVRLVAKKAKCHRGFKKVAWNAVGQRGAAAENGEGGSNGNDGEGGGQGAPGVGTLENRVATLTNKVNTLESVLKGITNADLTGLLGKLQGVSGTQLQEAIKSVANVNALSTEVGSLCTQAQKLTSQSNALRSALNTAEVLGLLGLSLAVPGLPLELPGFSCP